MHAFGFGLDSRDVVLAPLAGLGAPAHDALNTLQVRDALLNDGKLLLAREQCRERLPDLQPSRAERFVDPGLLRGHVQIGGVRPCLPLPEQQEWLVEDDLLLCHGPGAEARYQMDGAVADVRVRIRPRRHSIGSGDVDGRAIGERTWTAVVKEPHYVVECHR